MASDKEEGYTGFRQRGRIHNFIGDPNQISLFVWMITWYKESSHNIFLFLKLFSLVIFFILPHVISTKF